MTARRGSLVLTLCLGLLPACAVNGHGVMFRAESLANEGALGQRISGCGLLLSTRSVDRGLALGCMQRLYLCRPSSESSRPSSLPTTPAALQPQPLRARDAAGVPCAADPPAVLVSRTRGLELNASRLGTGIVFGQRFRIAQRIPDACSTITRVRIRNGIADPLALLQGDASCTDSQH